MERSTQEELPNKQLYFSDENDFFLVGGSVRKYPDLERFVADIVGQDAIKPRHVRRIAAHASLSTALP